MRAWARRKTNKALATDKARRAGEIAEQARADLSFVYIMMKYCSWYVPEMPGKLARSMLESLLSLTKTGAQGLRPKAAAGTASSQQSSASLAAVSCAINSGVHHLVPRDVDLAMFLHGQIPELLEQLVSQSPHHQARIVGVRAHPKVPTLLPRRPRQGEGVRAGRQAAAKHVRQYGLQLLDPRKGLLSRRGAPRRTRQGGVPFLGAHHAPARFLRVPPNYDPNEYVVHRGTVLFPGNRQLRSTPNGGVQQAFPEDVGCVPARGGVGSWHAQRVRVDRVLPLPAAARISTDSRWGGAAASPARHRTQSPARSRRPAGCLRNSRMRGRRPAGQLQDGRRQGQRPAGRLQDGGCKTAGCKAPRRRAAKRPASHLLA